MASICNDVRNSWKTPKLGMSTLGTKHVGHGNDALTPRVRAIIHLDSSQGNIPSTNDNNITHCSS